MVEFSTPERDRLEQLRAQYAAGLPAADQPAPESAALQGAALQRLANAAGFTLAMIPLGVGHHGVPRYFCRLVRPGDAGTAPLDVQFQVMPCYPAASEVDEVLAWIGGAIANHLTNGDIASWALVFGITSLGRTVVPPYRGLTQAGTDFDTFRQDQARLASAAATLLGPTHFRALLHEAGCELDWLPSVAD